eukprot:TRINITY_DN3569_c0_g2_i1.p1 TRINITY_DN3569_c0_g2~~TRINITY_DN3569_c0_g2_i1.p1  ORF type:complete len:1212 (-),score=305.94 TRINITY_DN3569_c0_g2_i1:1931-5425(-)
MYYMNQSTGEITENWPLKDASENGPPSPGSSVGRASGLFMSMDASEESKLGNGMESQGDGIRGTTNQQPHQHEELDILAIVVEMETTLKEMIRQVQERKDQKEDDELLEMKQQQHHPQIADFSLKILEEVQEKLSKLIEHEDERTASSDNLINMESLLKTAHKTANFEGPQANGFRAKLVKFVDQDISEEDFQEVTEENAQKMRRLRFVKDFQTTFHARQDLKSEDVDSSSLPLDLFLPRYFSNTPIFSGVENIPLMTVVRLPATHFEVVDNKLMVKPNDNPDEIVSKLVSTVVGRGTVKKGITIDGPADFVLKVKGSEDFFYGKEPFINYNYMRNCMNKQIQLDLMLVPKTEALEDARSFLLKEGAWNEWNLYLEKVQSLPKNKTSNFLEYSEIHKKPLKVQLIRSTFGNIDVKQLPGIHFIPEDKLKEMFITTLYVHGINHIFNSPIHSFPTTVASTTDWNLSVAPILSPRQPTTVTYEHLPRETRLVFVLCVATTENKKYPVAITEIQLIDQQGRLVQGRVELPFVPLSKDVIRSTRETKLDPWDFVFRSNFGCATVHGRHHRDPSLDYFGKVIVEFDDFKGDVLRLEAESEFNLYHSMRTSSTRLADVSMAKMPKEAQNLISQVCSRSLIGNLAVEEKEALWIARNNLVDKPEALIKFLMSTDWTDSDRRYEAYKLLKSWKYPRNLPEVLELLGPEVADSYARDFAVGLLHHFDAFQIRDVLPQLVQAIKHEPYAFSSLGMFLLMKSVTDPIIIGNEFFWYLKWEMMRPFSGEKFGLLLEALMCLTGPYALEYGKQSIVINRLERIGEVVISSKNRGLPKRDILKLFRGQLENLNNRLFAKVQFWRNPLNPTMILGPLDSTQCRYFSSKMAPLLLVFENRDEQAPFTSLILKVGDDVRQDILTLQLLRLFELSWRAQNIDLKLSPYAVLATGVSSQGKGVGLIEAVGKAETTSRIHWEYGGRFGALHRETLCRYLEHFNTTPQAYENAVELFMRSTAGYCVATFVLGIGDRHNGNIMIKEDGHLFHIDFGHILGNFKSKAGINRERSRFVFTPEMAYIIARKNKNYKKDSNYKKFVQFCVMSFQVLRESSRSWVALVRLLTPAGIPELRRLDDITYLYDRLMETVLPSEATKLLEAEIEKALNTKWRLFDNLVHTWVHES